MTQYQEVRTTQHEEGQEQRAATFKTTQIIWLFLGILEAVLALRVIFKLIGINAANSFATLLYNVTALFVAPFASLAGAPSAGGMVLEISSILAMIIYLLIGWGLVQIVKVLFYRSRGPVSVHQTTVAESTPPQAPVSVTQKTVDNRTNTQ
jgi:hypothetical protein